MITYIDSLLNRITMYRFTLYYLVALIGVSLIYTFVGLLPYSPIALLYSLILILITCWVTNYGCARLVSASTNTESVYITVCILTLIMNPANLSDVSGSLMLILTGAAAIASKYLITLHKKHLFNPAAFGALIAAFALSHPASWWVAGNIPLLPFILIGGLLLLRKVQRFDLILFCLVGAALSVLATSPTHSLASIPKLLEHSSLLFLAFVMLTEPITLPATQKKQYAYGAVVGLLFAPALHVASLYSTPELALLSGNLFSYIISPRRRISLVLKSIERTGATTSDFIFSSAQNMRFVPGQYMEWSLPHKNTDNRGNRRYFTVASAPSEKYLRLGVKFSSPSSSYKTALATLQPGAHMSALYIGGDFILPSDKAQKLVFIAGGIGITPFRSMLAELLHNKEKRDIILFYASRTRHDLAYKNLIDEATKEIGLKTKYVLSDEAESASDIYVGLITPQFILDHAADYKERVFYISGPYTMVTAFKKALTYLGVPRQRIKTDFFPGFA